ncbi:uncharacterized protein LOC118119321 [Hippoglossus stenolepis]|uniref:uncharacterized protein LOC118119321 n=1 Tax=Hippoglossus stenolepis TaxID=195615 RepID=UPI00159C1AC4|nr:uncharacterized protein LOC118119321 [Hippoglossus stenolepis]
MSSSGQVSSSGYSMNRLQVLLTHNMSRRRVRESWAVVSRTSPTWDEYYAVRARDATASAATETEEEHFSPVEEEKDPVDPYDEEQGSSTPYPVDQHPPSNASLPARATTSGASLHRAPRSRSYNPTQRRSSAASHPYRAQSYHESRRTCGDDCCFNYNQRSYRRRYTSGMSGRYRSRPSLEHIPVTIQPTRWYQVVGRRQCSNCRYQGRHQMTSWMCQSCKVPLCLMPFRNCYGIWHRQRC